MDVAIIDSGGANIASLVCAFERLEQPVRLTTDPALIEAADRVILPGVGAALDAMQRLEAQGLVDLIRRLEQPVLGICLGLQLLAEASEEDNADCLGLIAGTARRLPADPSLPTPNMGWSTIERCADHPLLYDVQPEDYFYFVHSYALPMSAETLASSMHAQAFSAVVSQRNFMATQFHPERSSAPGAKILSNFLELTA